MYLAEQFVGNSLHQLLIRGNRLISCEKLKRNFWDLARNILKRWGEWQIAYWRLEKLRYYQNWNSSLIAMRPIMIRILTGRIRQQRVSHGNYNN